MQVKDNLFIYQFFWLKLKDEGHFKYKIQKNLSLSKLNEKFNQNIFFADGFIFPVQC